ncbi:putative reverse transcriptase domain-containing protein [Tanacetum coccineum]
MKQLMTAEFCPIEEVQRIEHELWNLKVKEYDVGEVTSSKPADLNKAVRMAHKLMEQKSQARDARILEGKKRKSFVNTRFSSLLNIKPIKIEGSYEVELADGRILGTFDVIIGMDWLVKHDAVIVCGEKVVCIPYGNKMFEVRCCRTTTRAVGEMFIRTSLSSRGALVLYCGRRQMDLLGCPMFERIFKIDVCDRGYHQLALKMEDNSITLHLELVGKKMKEIECFGKRKGYP